MKIKVSMVIEVLRYWMTHGKTMTSLISGFITIAVPILLEGAGLGHLAPDMTEILIALAAEGALGFVGVWHKIVKFVAKKKAEGLPIELDAAIPDNEG